MVKIRVEQHIPASVTAVWDEVARIDRHVEWMADAERITFLSEATSGVGTRIEVLTKVGPLSTSDVMEFTGWEPPHRMTVTHRGVVTGVGAFTLEAVGDEDTRFVWEEELTFPARFGGRVMASAAAPVLRAVWRRNLGRLAARF